MQPHLYEEVILSDLQGGVWTGQVVSHLQLSDWADWRRFQVVHAGGYRPALVWERTQLSPQSTRKFSGVFPIPSWLHALIGKEKQ